MPSPQVLDISGVFLCANDPADLKAWYEAHFGLRFQRCEEGRCYGLDLLHTLPDGRRSHTVFSLMKAKEPLTGPRQECMVNGRVGDLDAFRDAPVSQGVPVDKREDCDYGRSAWIQDPEGNPIELYQPLKEPGSF